MGTSKLWALTREVGFILDETFFFNYTDLYLIFKESGEYILVYSAFSFSVCSELGPGPCQPHLKLWCPEMASFFLMDH